MNRDNKCKESRDDEKTQNLKEPIIKSLSGWGRYYLMSRAELLDKE